MFHTKEPSGSGQNNQQREMDCSIDDQAAHWHEMSFAETNLRMLEEELLCDVTFLVGKKQEPVKVHRFMLASRSPVFYAMFCGLLAENQEAIPVPDIEVDIFKLVLRFLYTANCPLTGDSVMAALYAAKKYELEALTKKCTDFLHNHIDDENACTILQLAITFDEKALIKQSLSYVFVNGRNVMQSAGFLTLGRGTLQTILESDDLYLDELSVYRGCVQWAQHQCSEAKEETNDVNVRKCLGDFIYLIRFPLMSIQEFTEHVSQSGVLRDDEKLVLFQGFCVNMSDKHRFVPRPRSADMIFERFQEIYHYWCHDGTENAISFSCSSTVRLRGVFLFSPYEAGTVSGELEVADDTETLWKTDFSMKYDADKRTEEIVIEPPLYLERGKTFHLIQTCEGLTYFGMHGKTEEKRGTKVTFCSSPRNRVGTNDENKGQFFALHLI